MPATTTGELTISEPSARGFCTVTYPSGEVKKWKTSTVEARGYTVPQAEVANAEVANADASARQSFAVIDRATGSESRYCEIFAGDLSDGDVFNVAGEDVAASDVSISGRDVTFRLNGFRRKASVYGRVTIVA